jgi:hypothetical protein
VEGPARVREAPLGTWPRPTPWAPPPGERVVGSSSPMGSRRRCHRRGVGHMLEELDEAGVLFRSATEPVDTSAPGGQTRRTGHRGCWQAVLDPARQAERRGPASGFAAIESPFSRSNLRTEASRRRAVALRGFLGWKWLPHAVRLRRSIRVPLHRCQARVVVRNLMEMREGDLPGGDLVIVGDVGGRVLGPML